MINKKQKHAIKRQLIYINSKLYENRVQSKKYNTFNDFFCNKRIQKSQENLELISERKGIEFVLRMLRIDLK